jgi:hypothetical protein
MKEIYQPGYLSRYFSIKEMLFSQTAIRHNIENIPNEKQLENLQYLCVNCLDPIRAGIGKAIHVNSGFRCLELNLVLPGDPKSQHKKGEAADIVNYSMTATELFTWIINNDIPFDQIILEYKLWVHISCKKSGNRGEIKTAEKDRDTGRTIYLPYDKNNV